MKHYGKRVGQNIKRFTVELSESLVELIDNHISKRNLTKRVLVESWLRRGARNEKDFKSVIQDIETPREEFIAQCQLERQMEKVING